MLKQILEKPSDIQAGKIPFAELNIKSDPFPFRRNRKRTDRGDSMLLIHVITMGRSPFRSPRAGNRGDKQKATLIQKEQMGPKSFGVFLYTAIGAVSNGQFLLHSSAKPGVRVSGNSTPCRGATAKRDWGGIESQIPFGSVGLFVAGSKDPYDIHTKGDLQGVVCLTSLSALKITLPGALERFSGATPWDPESDMIGTSVRQNSWMPLASGQLPTDLLSPLSTIEWRRGAASPILVGSHGVACPK
jgi:hypothetical protein